MRIHFWTKLVWTLVVVLIHIPATLIILLSQGSMAASNYLHRQTDHLIETLIRTHGAIKK